MTGVNHEGRGRSTGEGRPHGARAIAVAAMLTMTGCRVYDPALLTAPGACAALHPPARPAAMDSGEVEVAFGLRNVVLAQADGWANYGYDLDDACTSAPTYAAECTPPSGGRPPVDGPGGVDNVFGALLYPLVALTTPRLEEQSRATIEAGLGLPIMRVRGWNGTPNDPRLDVSIMQAVFGAPGSADLSPPPVPANPGTARPAWDGRDWFWVRDDAFLRGSLESPLIRDDNAYIADGVFVARLPDRVDIVFAAETNGVLVRITGAVATGRLSADGLSLEEVRVSGRWAINDLLATARNIGVCEGERDYELLAGQLDRIADVRSTPGTGGPGVECNALSLGVGFTGTRVRVAGVAPGPELPDLCVGLDGGTPADAGVGDGG